MTSSRAALIVGSHLGACALNVVRPAAVVMHACAFSCEPLACYGLTQSARRSAATPVARSDRHDTAAPRRPDRSRSGRSSSRPWVLRRSTYPAHRTRRRRRESPAGRAIDGTTHKHLAPHLQRGRTVHGSLLHVGQRETKLTYSAETDASPRGVWTECHGGANASFYRWSPHRGPRGFWGKADGNVKRNVRRDRCPPTTPPVTAWVKPARQGALRTRLLPLYSSVRGKARTTLLQPYCQAIDPERTATNRTTRNEPSHETLLR